jgi:Transcription factor involved in chromatin remodeling, contains bromodomain
MLSSSSSVSLSENSSLEMKKKKKSKKAPATSTASTSASASASSHHKDIVASSEKKKMHAVNIDPETSLDIGNDYKENPFKYNRLVGTVHWDPDSEQGQKVGHRIRVWDFQKSCWKSGRVVRYDPVTHQHKIAFFTGKSDDDQYEEEWLLLSRENVQLGGRFVWALVKGFAWWPAQVLHCSFGSSKAMPKSYFNKKDLTSQPMRDGYVLVEFFDSDEVASVKDSPDFMRDFQQGKVDAVMRKNKKKISAKAVETCRQEEIATREVRNDAARFYAERAFECVNRLEANHLLGSRIEIFRNDINYPVGEYVYGVVRMYSTTMKKFLVAYDPPPHNSKQYEPSWESLTGHKNYKVLDNIKEKVKAYEPSDIDLYPFLFGHEENDGGIGNRCRGCVGECHPEKDTILKCSKCRGLFHPKCLDPPLSEKMVENLLKSGDDWNCNKCIKCIGCREYDIAFGTKTVPTPPPSLFLPFNTSLRLCNACLPMYEKEMFCPVCAHVWDDCRYEHVQKQLKIENKSDTSELGTKRIAISDCPGSGYISKDCVGSDNKGVLSANVSEGNIINSSNIVEDFGDSSFRWKLPCEIKDSWFYPENNVWGYNEGTMLSCEKCNLWVHAACAALTKDEYDKTTRGEHPVYSREYLCRKCCKEKCLVLMNLLREEDTMYLFAEPVTDQIAHNYSDVIKNPMDLRTMSERALSGCYRNYSWLREAFELMVYNALLFNPAHSKYWNEAKRFYFECKKKVFSTEGKGVPPSKYKMMIKERFELAEKIIQAEKDRIKADVTAKKKDLVAGDQVMTVELSPLVPPPDPPSCVPTTVVRMTPFDAFYWSWLECCFCCGSSGALDTMLFCVDCGEAYHSFCASAPIHSMNVAAVEGWRCPNCKVCEITGEVTSDELKLLYCEMCDRAFSIDSIDPPLSKVPSGLWICGQCVDCKKCNNSCDKGNVSRKYWSRHPSLCLPCGGCDGLDILKLKNAKCSVCNKRSRSLEGLAQCSRCKSFIHNDCDKNTSLNIIQNGGKVSYVCVNHGKQIHLADVLILNMSGFFLVLLPKMPTKRIELFYQKDK